MHIDLNAYQNQTGLSETALNGLASVISPSKLIGLFRFITLCQDQIKAGNQLVTGDELLDLAEKCFGKSIRNVAWDAPPDQKLASLADYLGIPEEKYIDLKNVFAMLYEESLRRDS